MLDNNKKILDQKKTKEFNLSRFDDRVISKTCEILSLSFSR